MLGSWMTLSALVLMVTLVGCAPQAALPRGPSVAEAAVPPPSPATGTSVFTAAWDSDLHALRIEAVLTADGTQNLDWRPLVLEDSGRHLAAYAFSSDESVVALLSGTAPFCARMAGGSACWQGADRLHVVELESGTVDSYDLGPAVYVPAISFSPDASSLAFASHGPEGFAVRRLHLDGGGSIDSSPLSFLPSFLAFSMNGRELTVLGDLPGNDPGMAEPGPLTVAVIDAESLAVLWDEALDIRHGAWCLEGCTDSHEQTLFANWTPAVVRLPGADEVVIVHADADRLTTIDAARRRVQTQPLVAARTWLDRLMALGTMPAEAKGGSQGVYRQAVASPDGTRLYLVGREFDAWRDADGSMQMSDTPLGLQVIDPSTGTRLISLKTGADHVSLGGDMLFLRAWEGPDVWTEILPLPSLDPGRSVEGWDVQTTRDLQGMSILIATSPGPGLTRVGLVDPATLDIGSLWQIPGETTLLLP